MLPTLPFLDQSKPDPFFHLVMTPAIYWFGLILATFAVVGMIFWKITVPFPLLLITILLLSSYVNNIPKLFYFNPIYTDTYIFVGETLYTLRTGHIGWGHSSDTPGLDLLSSQICLVLGINETIAAELILFSLPLITTLLIFVLSKHFFGDRGALLACLFSFSINWLGFAFNRQTLGVTLFILVFFAFLKTILNSKRSYLWGTATLLSYFALVLIHPISSLLIIVTALIIPFLPFLITFIRRIHTLPYSQEERRLWKSIAIRAMFYFGIFSIIWALWNMYTYTNIDYAIRTLDESFRGLLGLPHVEQPGALISGYTSVYLPVVQLRFIEILFAIIIGVVLGIAILSIESYRPRNAILFAWFGGSIWLIFFGFFGNWLQLLLRPFLHAYIIASMLFAWFILTHHKREMIIVKYAKSILLCTMLIFFAVTPLTMYSQAPFTYPPTIYFKEEEHVVTYGNGTIAVFESGSEYGYYRLLYNLNSTTLVSYEQNYTEYKTVITGHRGYAKDAFFVYTPSLTDLMNRLEDELADPVHFSKVYDGDSWHRVYFNQTFDSTNP